MKNETNQNGNRVLTFHELNTKIYGQTNNACFHYQNKTSIHIFQF